MSPPLPALVSGCERPCPRPLLSFLCARVLCGGRGFGAVGVAVRWGVCGCERLCPRPYVPLVRVGVSGSPPPSLAPLPCARCCAVGVRCVPWGGVPRVCRLGQCCRGGALRSELGAGSVWACPVLYCTRGSWDAWSCSRSGASVVLWRGVNMLCYVMSGVRQSGVRYAGLIGV